MFVMSFSNYQRVRALKVNELWVAVPYVVLTSKGSIKPIFYLFICFI